MPLSEVAGKTGAGSPAHIDKVVPKLKTGVMIGFTVTVKVTGGAHWPGSGVKEYTPLLVLLTTAGLHMPVMPLVEVGGKAGTASPSQMEALAPNGKTGGIVGSTTTVNEVPVTHPVVVGVKI